MLLTAVFAAVPARAQADLPGLLDQTSVDPAIPERTIEAVPAASDADVATRLQRILEATGWFTNPAVRVQEGVVFLEGTAETRERSTWAGNLAKSTEGVVAVVNNLAVASDLQTTFERALSELRVLVDRALQAWPMALLVFIIVVASWLVAKLIAMIARPFIARRVSSPLLMSVILRAISLPVFVLGIYFVLRIAGLTQLALTILGGTGLVGIIIGFAFRDIAENFLASLLLSVRNPFNSGDLIEVAGYTGVVQNLNTRSTVLLTLNGNHVQIPNATVFKSIIKNYSSIPSRRAEYVVGISYDSSVVLAQELIGGVLKAHPAVLDKPEPLVLVDQLGDATVNMRVFYWFDSAAYSPAKINSALLRLTKNALYEGGVEMPDPAREVVFPQGVPIIQADANSVRPAPAPHPRKRVTEEATDATAAEGDLTSETREIGQQREGRIPESETNLLKD
ncbi:mechanosensitive ion channel domain-containing protein [Devosia sp.]|uniref:mechanosensitive ion channel domain-containing protein n=1 Tax=Devosia sp. TaxID=1871048 RepID=UPI003A91B7E8